MANALGFIERTLVIDPLVKNPLRLSPGGQLAEPSRCCRVWPDAANGVACKASEIFRRVIGKFPNYADFVISLEENHQAPKRR